ncbi:MBL fold metallo-hydrolase [uncultured Aquimarina sp.]|uniref:MBL fold metallo-hydrolase n=1 Tax=uncultured Aquimarina sp. TaxID=575652 RepID=UPI00262482C9|nr:MBL fold metallo-hydrolase [uncultured Aquimarina sp.]
MKNSIAFLTVLIVSSLAIAKTIDSDSLFRPKQGKFNKEFIKTKEISNMKTTDRNIRIPNNQESTESIRLLRNATLVINFGGKKLLIDPMFAEKGAFPAFDGAGNDFRNPMVDLPISEREIKNIVDETDAVFVTHTHLDHWDPKAQQLIPKDKLIFVQPSDEELIRSQGFTNVKVIQKETIWEEITLSRTGGQHGFGKVGELMGEVSGFVFATSNKKIYVAGDTRWAKEVKSTISQYNPDIIVLNAGGAQFIEGNKKGDPITMTPEDIIEVHKNATNAEILTVHMNTLNHCFIKRKDLKKQLIKEGVEQLIQIPEDGETFIIN